MNYAYLMDVLSDVLAALQLQSRLYFRAELGGAWAVRLPRESNAVRFHLVLQGECWVGVDGEKPIALSAGDTILVPHGAPQVLSDKPDRTPMPLADLRAVQFRRQPSAVAGAAAPYRAARGRQHRRRLAGRCVALHELRSQCRSAGRRCGDRPAG